MNSNSRSSYYMTIIGILFFIFGFVTWLNNVLLPFLKQACELSDLHAWFVTFAFYIAYLVTALPSSALLKKIGYSKGISVGLLIMMVGSLLFIPAALNRNYIIFLIALFTQGVGLSLLQTAANPYVTIIGPIESAAKRMSIMGVCNKVAGMIGIFLLTNMLFGGTEHISEKLSTLTGSTASELAEKAALLNQLTHNVIFPYSVMAAILLSLAIMVIFSKLPDIKIENNYENQTEKKSVFNYPYMILGVIALFFYVGVEVLAIDSLNLYGQELGYSANESKWFGVSSLIAMTAGYLLAIILIPKYIKQRDALVFQTGLAMVLVICALFLQGMASILCIVALSFTHAIMWPAIWPLSLDGLGKHTKLASALLIMAIAGGAIIPLVYGKVADIFSRHLAYTIMLPCYVFIIYFATLGWKTGKK